ncbi:tannase/feruloyl esterase family alpha/beta hydrolase [Ramlibacter henchirensis]|uniref:Tannase/feruloyl esterase family alpha/beta hydrolase n=1 Tax=Ramlibacter henchirensis TaxID=204072 RepID=A0A4Z0C4Q7_9BURK|nr:tannase/feruloyl esterase family alpha/beta hydrolase [Ramlibacter henchirensis]TFZ06271.1 tannase/feruloyl esterase family alpha/beta hydrolase [Ramlibacter henchirensis]
MTRTSCRTALGALAAAALAACTSTPPQEAAPVARGLGAAKGAALRNCAELKAFAFEQTSIDSAAPVAAGAQVQGGKPLPAYCLVTGSMNRRQGSDGREYAIGFEMRLPQAWNGRFYYQANGGLDGNVVPALGALGGGPVTGALMQGFAVISSNAGHTAAQTPVFGLEPQARLDYGYQAVMKLTPMAKALIAQAYGKGPDRSYIGGCSNGGRHAMVAAARLGEQYDGYLAGAPGYRLPHAALAQLWGAQQWNRIATQGATTRHPMNPNATIPDLGTAFTARERQSVAQSIVQRCDALDGASDGMVLATQACQAAFDIRRDVPSCGAAGRDGSCLTPDQKSVVAAVFAGARAPSGEALYSPFPYDPGVAGSNWATWKFVNPLVLDPVAVGTVFTAPPAPVDTRSADIAFLLRKVHAVDGPYRESGAQLMMPPGQQDPRNLAPLAQRGAKMVLYHGVSDPVFSAEDTRQWYERLDRALGGRAREFARYFPVPGMNHCSAGPAADQFDLLAPLVRWVEDGVPPQAVTASVRGEGNPGGANAELPAGWSPQRTRPLCAYPTVARYMGIGSVEDASSFACR